MELIENYKKLIKEIDDILSLGNDGLLKSEKMYQVIYAVEDKLKEISKELDERSKLSIEKNIPMWRNVPKNGIFVHNEEVINRVTPLKALLLELLSKQDNGEIIQTKQEMVIPMGKQYNGRLYLRNILQQASISIFIRDSYFRPTILDILLEYLLDNNSLKIEILMGNNNRLSPLKASYEAFRKEYPTLNLSVRYSNQQDNDHPRYIFIDDQLLFNPDHSLDQWGEKTVNIHQLLDVIEIDKVRQNINREWNVATNI